MDKIQLTVIMCSIAEKVSEQIGLSGNMAFTALSITDDHLSRPFIWQVGQAPPRLYFTDSSLDMFFLAKHYEEYKNKGIETLYYKWDGQLLYPCLSFTVQKIILDAFGQQQLIYQMVEITEKMMGSDIQHYPLKDIEFVLQTKSQAPFFWVVTPSRTHLVPADDNEALDKFKDILKQWSIAACKCSLYAFDGSQLKSATLEDTLINLESLTKS